MHLGDFGQPIQEASLQFRVDPALVRAEGIDPERPYALLRLVDWGAAHDWGEGGLGAANAVADALAHLDIAAAALAELDLPRLEAAVASVDEHRLTPAGIHHGKLRDAGGPQCRDVLVAKAKRAQDRVGVLAEGGHRTRCVDHAW